MKFNIPKFRTTNFTIDFFEKRSINSFYQSILNNTNGNPLFNKNLLPEHSPDLVEIKLIPPYLHPNYTGGTSSMKVFIFYRTLGYLANLDGFGSLDDYMTKKMGVKQRSKIRNRVRRLEKCFNISYKIYFGEISRKEYDNLFERFESLIIRRFAQRGDIHHNLKNWRFYKKSTYKYILEKKASLFVIYDQNIPIDICLNYHYQNIVNQAIRTYDIDYAKFNLGNIDIYKQLEWCFENNFKIFDLMWGDLEYKKRWCNQIFLYEHHLFCNKDFILSAPLAHLIIKLYKFKDFLKQKKVLRYLQQIKLFFKKKQDYKPDIVNYTIEKSDIRDTSQIDNLIEINLNTEEFAFLRKPTYDFQFGFSESTRDIGVYKMAKQNASYLIIGKNRSQKIDFK